MFSHGRKEGRRKKEGRKKNPHLDFSRRNDPLCLNFADCLVGVWRVFGNRLKGVWQLSERCLEGVLRVSGRCLEGALRVSGWYICDVQKMLSW